MRTTSVSLLVARAGAAAVLALLPPLFVAVPAAAQSAAPDSTGRTCILLFMSGAGYGSGVEDLADLRALGEQELAGALDRARAAPLAADVSLALQRRWRIRDGQLLPPDFLAGLGSAGADRLLLVHLYVGRDRIELAGRTLAAGTGLIESAATSTCFLGGATWRVDFATACRRLVATLATTIRQRTGTPLAPLAVHPLGFDAATAQIATQCLIEAALADSACAVLEPAVLGGALVAGGADPHRLDRSGLELLAGAFGVSEVILVEMITRDPDQTAPTSTDDIASSGAALQESVTAFSLHLRAVDARTGLVAAASDSDQDNSPAKGWFGNVGSNTPRQLISAAMHRLWEDSQQPGKVR